MQLQSGDVVIAPFWKKWRPLVVLEINKKEKTCIVAPVTTHKFKTGRQRRELAKGHTLSLGPAEEFGGRAIGISYLRLNCIQYNYYLSNVKKKIGSLGGAVWVTIMMHFYLHMEKKNGTS
jgi:hypothetical protein